jgi:hypothetical protein
MWHTPAAAMTKRANVSAALSQAAAKSQHTCATGDVASYFAVGVHVMREGLIGNQTHNKNQYQQIFHQQPLLPEQI